MSCCNSTRQIHIVALLFVDFSPCSEIKRKHLLCVCGYVRGLNLNACLLLWGCVIIASFSSKHKTTTTTAAAAAAKITSNGWKYSVYYRCEWVYRLECFSFHNHSHSHILSLSFHSRIYRFSTYMFFISVSTINRVAFRNSFLFLFLRSCSFQFFQCNCETKKIDGTI